MYTTHLVHAICPHWKGFFSSKFQISKNHFTSRLKSLQSLYLFYTHENVAISQNFQQPCVVQTKRRFFFCYLQLLWHFSLLIILEFDDTKHFSFMKIMTPYYFLMVLTDTDGLLLLLGSWPPPMLLPLPPLPFIPLPKPGDIPFLLLLLIPLAFWPLVPMPALLA